MAVKMRLARMGKKKGPFYRVVVCDSRTSRTGRYIEQLGTYDPRQEPSAIDIDHEKARQWLQKGARPSDTVKRLLRIGGFYTQEQSSKQAS